MNRLLPIWDWTDHRGADGLPDSDDQFTSFVDPFIILMRFHQTGRSRIDSACDR